MLCVVVTQSAEHALRDVRGAHSNYGCLSDAFEQAEEPLGYAVDCSLSVCVTEERPEVVLTLRDGEEFVGDDLVIQVVGLYSADLVGRVGLSHLYGESVDLFAAYRPREVDEEVIVNLAHCVICYLSESRIACVVCYGYLNERPYGRDRQQGCQGSALAFGSVPSAKSRCSPEAPQPSL